MTITLTPREALNKAFLKVKPTRIQIEEFKHGLKRLLAHIDNHESEENQKILLIDFFKQTCTGEDYYVNTKDRIDLVIHNGSSAKTNAGVLFEVKRTTNTTEMPSKNELNSKALQELLLYYLRERVISENIEIKHLIITNSQEWFIFDANIFEKVFVDNKKLVRLFIEFEQEGKDTSFFYTHIASKVIEASKDQLTHTYFDLNKYRKIIVDEVNNNDNKLIPLYKILSPEHLLKKPFLNDSNSLNKFFYVELLYLIGLEEVKVGGKKLIKRKSKENRNSGSLLEEAMSQITSKGIVYQIKNADAYGHEEEEQIQNIALELTLTWINRLLFLKLLEAQLVKYHKGDNHYAFLNSDHIKTFNDLDTLFFQVLAVKTKDRIKDIKETFKNVPYLNSSLFEPTDTERGTIYLSSLNGRVKLPILNTSVLKNINGKRRTGELLTLPYLLEFLDCFDFTSEGAEEIQEDNKPLISASVLGLIFEKINGYKEGSFYTPSFVTMFMCRNVITDVIVKKFNDVKNWECKNLVDLYNNINDKSEANTIINSIKICDPAVGSGHFLVSALNEIIYIKSYLGILVDKEGRTLKDYSIDVVNDELIVTDSEGHFVEYQPTSRESERVQETFFREKQNIIENCLFGVDINKNSAMICRLRLWIELLKNAYYKANGELETLPNIDINIKTGDSLIGKFKITTDLKDAFKQSKVGVAAYKEAVTKYKNASDKSEKRNLEALIKRIKANYTEKILDNDPRYIEVRHLEMGIEALQGQHLLFELDESQDIKNKKKILKMSGKLNHAKQIIAEIEGNRIFRNAFEWRIEFPEVLGVNGEYVGFDIIIGNPPYIDSEAMVNEGMDDERRYLTENYSMTKGNWDIYIAFFERGLSLLQNNGSLIYITPDKWLAKGFGQALREISLPLIKSVTQVGRDVFENAKVDSIISHFNKCHSSLLSTGKFSDDVYRKVNTISKSEIAPPYALDYLFSENLKSLSLIERVGGKVKDYLVCENACSTSDCYRLKEFIEELAEDDIKDYYTVVNTGTISKYVTRWGEKQMTYLKGKYIKPVIRISVFTKNFKNTYYAKSILPKMIIKGLTKLDVALDLAGKTIPGKSTLIFTSSDTDKLKLLSGIINSSLAIKYIAEKYSAASYNGGINFTKEMLNEFPFPLQKSVWKKKIIECVNRALKTPSKINIIQKEIDILTYHLYGLSYLELEEIFRDELNLSEEEFMQYA
jgi:adenine-specific DNA-methyltransferase